MQFRGKLCVRTALPSIENWGLSWKQRSKSRNGYIEAGKKMKLDKWDIAMLIFLLILLGIVVLDLMGKL